MGLKLDARAGCLFFAFLMIAGKKFNLNPSNVLPDFFGTVWSFIAAYGFYALGAVVAWHVARPHVDAYLDARHKQNSMAAATDSARVEVLETERARIRAMQQDKHRERTAQKAAEDEQLRRRRRLEAAQGRASRRAAQETDGGGGGSGSYNPMAPEPTQRYTPSAPGGDCGPGG